MSHKKIRTKNELRRAVATESVIFTNQQRRKHRTKWEHAVIPFGADEFERLLELSRQKLKDVPCSVAWEFEGVQATNAFHADVATIP